MRPLNMKLILTFIVVSLLVSTLAGCKNTGEKAKSAGEDKNVKLTYFSSLVPQHAGATVKNLSETPLYQELEKRTGVKLEFVHPVSGQETEQFNLMVASNELPDIVEWTWSKFPGGPEQAIANGQIVKLNSYIDNNAPNLKKFITENKEYDKMIKTNDSSYYVFPFLRGDNELLVFQGPVLRKDWLEELGLQVPSTIDEWETVLTAFKDKKDAIPFTTLPVWLNSSRAFIGAYGVCREYYQENGKVKYGPIEPGYKEYLALMKRWYGKGLIDKDFASQTGDSFDAKVTSNKAGSMIAMLGSQLGKYINLMKDKDPKFDLIAAPFPTLNKGELPKFSSKVPAFDGFGAAISGNCKEKEAAAKLLDYGYSEEGHMLYNFGIENESYKMENGYPKYMDIIIKNPQGLSIAAAMGRYMRSMGNGSFVQDVRYVEQYSSLQQQKNAIEQWKKADDTSLMPPVTPVGSDTQRYASIMNQVNTYLSEFELKVIMGVESPDSFDKFVDTCKKMGIEEAIRIQQTALDKYNER